MNLDEIIALAADTGAVAYSPPPLRAVRGYSFTYDALEAFYHAAIESYKAELLKEAGEPVAYMTTDEEGSASMLFFDRAEALKYSGDEEPVNLFAESQLQAAQEEWNQCSGLLDDSLRSIEMLEDQLAKAEQRVAEWQPIETAPKDGTFILVWNIHGVNEVTWDSHQEGWFYDVDGDVLYPLRGDLPTHWMPLPEAPKGEQK